MASRNSNLTTEYALVVQALNQSSLVDVDAMFENMTLAGRDFVRGDNPFVSQFIEDLDLTDAIPWELDVKCGANEVFDECDTGCYQTCETLFSGLPDICPIGRRIRNCEGDGACICRNGFFRLSEDNLTCTREENCPHNNCEDGFLYRSWSNLIFSFSPGVNRCLIFIRC